MLKQRGLAYLPGPGQQQDRELLARLVPAILHSTIQVHEILRQLCIMFAY
jgi:hypothetical protein